MNKFKTFLTELKAAFAKLFSAAKTSATVVNKDFTLIVGSDAAVAFKTEAESILKSALGVITKGVVAGLTTLAPTLSDPEKRAEALKQIAVLAKAQGISATDSIINLFIELAVTTLKSKV